jgi:hypothetical protein
MTERDGIGRATVQECLGSAMAMTRVTKMTTTSTARTATSPTSRSIFFHATTNQKHAGLTAGGWDRPHNRARTLGECDGNDKGNRDDDKEYGEDGDIPDDYNKYAGGRQTTKNYTTTNQKHAGLMGERQDMRRNWQEVRWERKLIVFWQLIWDSVKN